RRQGQPHRQVRTQQPSRTTTTGDTLPHTVKPDRARPASSPARRASSVASRQARIASPGGCPRVRSLVTESAATILATPIALRAARILVAGLFRERPIADDRR